MTPRRRSFAHQWLWTCRNLLSQARASDLRLEGHRRMRLRLDIRWKAICVPASSAVVKARVEALLTRLGLKVVPDVPRCCALSNCARGTSFCRGLAQCLPGRAFTLGTLESRRQEWQWPGAGNTMAHTLLYVGIAPNKRRERSLERLRARIHSHFAGNAEASCLRLALGCLLAAKLGLELRGAVEAVTTCRFRLEGEEGYRDGEKELSEWMAAQCFRRVDGTLPALDG